MFLLNILFLVIFILVLAGWISATFMLIQVGENKGYDMSKAACFGLLVFLHHPLFLVSIFVRCQINKSHQRILRLLQNSLQPMRISPLFKRNNHAY